MCEKVWSYLVTGIHCNYFRFLVLSAINNELRVIVYDDNRAAVPAYTLRDITAEAVPVSWLILVIVRPLTNCPTILGTQRLDTSMVKEPIA